MEKINKQQWINLIAIPPALIVGSILGYLVGNAPDYEEIDFHKSQNEYLQSRIDNMPEMRIEGLIITLDSDNPALRGTVNLSGSVFVGEQGQLDILRGKIDRIISFGE